MMQRPRLRKTRGAAAAAELELWGVRGGRLGIEGSDEGLWAGLIYKVRLVSGREKRGDHGVIISPQKRLDFRDGH